MNLTRCLVIVAVTELLFVVATRIVLHYYSWSSLGAESIRTVLRIVTATIYWMMLRPLILSRASNPSAFLSPLLIVGLLLFLLIPLVVGHYNLTAPVALMFAVTSIPVAVKEEFLFRGIIQNLLTDKFGFVNSVVFTSALFTAWHIGVWQPTFWAFAQIFLASILLGIVYMYSGSIFAVIIIHATYDALFSFPSLLAVPLNENWGFIPLLSAVALVFYWALGTKRAHPSIKRAR